MPRPTDMELAILEVLSDLGGATIRQILKCCNEAQAAPAGYTIIIKMIRIMTEKGRDQTSASE